MSTIMEVPKEFYDIIRQKLVRTAITGVAQQIHKDEKHGEVIDMTGIIITPEKQSDTSQKD